MKHFGNNDGRNYDDNSRNYGYGGANISTEEMAKAFFFAKDATTEEELKEKLEKYFSEKKRRVKKVYLFGPGEKDFVTDKEDAEMVADEGFKVRGSLAWVDENGELTLMTKEEMKDYFKNHPRR